MGGIRIVKRYIALCVITILVSVLLVGQAIGTQATSTVPGSADDPLVTKGYVDELIKSLNVDSSASVKLEMEQMLKEYQQKLDDIVAKASGEVGGNELIVVELFQGDVLKGKSGTEIIVRTGKTTIVAAENGIPDVTDGKDLAKGTEVPLNHHLIVPRDDGRGIESDRNSTQPVFVMVRGEYELVRAQ